MKRLMILVSLLAMLVGSPVSRGATQLSSGDMPQLEEVQVIKQNIGYPTPNTEQGLSYDSLAPRMPFIVEVSTTPEITNYNKNYISVHGDTLMTDNVVKTLDEISANVKASIDSIISNAAQKIGEQSDILLETLVRRKRLEARAYLAWPILTVLSLALLAFSTIVERRLLQQMSAALVVASIIGSIVYLPDILMGLSTHEYNIYNLLLGL